MSSYRLKKSSIKGHPVLSAVQTDKPSPKPKVIHASGDEPKQYILTDDLTTSPKSQSKPPEKVKVFEQQQLGKTIKGAIEGENYLVLNLKGELKTGDFSTSWTDPYSLSVKTDGSDVGNILEVRIKIGDNIFVLDLHGGKFVVLSKYEEPRSENPDSLHKIRYVNEDTGIVERSGYAVRQAASKAPNSHVVVGADIPTQIPGCTDQDTCKAALKQLLGKELNYNSGGNFITSLEVSIREEAIQYAAHALAHNGGWEQKPYALDTSSGIVYNTVGKSQLQSWSNGQITDEEYVKNATNWVTVFPYTTPAGAEPLYMDAVRPTPRAAAPGSGQYADVTFSGNPGAPAARVDNGPHVTYATIAHPPSLEEYQEQKKVFTGELDKTVLQQVGNFLFAKKGTDYFLYKLKQQSPPIYLKYEITINDRGTYTLKNQKSTTEFVTQQQTVASIIKTLRLDPRNVIIPEETYNTMVHVQGGKGRATKKRRKTKRSGGARTNKRRKSAVKSRKRRLPKNKKAKRSRKALRRR